MASSPEFYMILSGLIFSIGLMGLMVRRNPLVLFMSIELMLNASNLAFMTFGRFAKEMGHNLGSGADGPAFTFVVMTIAAAEAVVGLGIIITIFRNRNTVDVDVLTELKG